MEIITAKCRLLCYVAQLWWDTSFKSLQRIAEFCSHILCMDLNILICADSGLKKKNCSAISVQFTSVETASSGFTICRASSSFHSRQRVVCHSQWADKVTHDNTACLIWLVPLSMMWRLKGFSLKLWPAVFTDAAWMCQLCDTVYVQLWSSSVRTPCRRHQVFTCYTVRYRLRPQPSLLWLIKGNRGWKHLCVCVHLFVDVLTLTWQFSRWAQRVCVSWNQVILLAALQMEGEELIQEEEGPSEEEYTHTHIDHIHLVLSV